MRTGNRRQGRSSKTSGTPLDTESRSPRGKGASGGKFKPKREGGYASRSRKPEGEGTERKPYGDKPFSRGAGKPYGDRKKSFGGAGRFQKDKPAFNKEGGSDRPRFSKDGGNDKPRFRREGAAGRPP